MRSKAFLLAVVVALGLVRGLEAQVSVLDLGKADVNDDFIVDNADLAIVRAAVGKRQGQAGYDPRADMDGNRIITVADLSFVQRYIGQRVPLPTIAGAIAPAPNAAGWNNTDVTVTFTCTNATACQPPASVTTEGANQSVIGNASGPGGLASTTVTVNIDKTAPVVLITTPADGSSTEAASVALHGTYPASASPIQSVTCNGAPAASFFDGFFDCTVALALGSNQITAVVTDAAGNQGSAAITVTRPSPVRINEVESSGGVPGDWAELYNTGAAPVDISGFVFKDNDNTHVHTIPPTAPIAPGAYYVIEEAALGFGLGGADSARLFAADGTTLIDSYTWAAHATTTYGRCPNGTGAFVTTTSVTKGAANDCAFPVPTVSINEVESSGGVPGDWAELYNTGAAPVDISGFVFKDNDNTHVHTIPPTAPIPAGGYFVLEEAAFGFGLGGADSARLFAADGTTLIDTYTWPAHATTTYGRCPNGTGAFAETTSSTKGAANTCAGDPLPWPGDAAVQTTDGVSVFGGNLSGLAYEGSGTQAPGVLWGARNGPGSLFRLVWNGTIWTPDPSNDWGAGKTLLYPGGTGSPDSEGVAFTDLGAAGGLYVSTERDNNANGISRNSILRFDPAAAGTSLTATHEWNLTADLPAVGANLGMEGITWVPDVFLVSRGFLDESKGHAYNPAVDYPSKVAGLFFVGLEANGVIYAYALDQVGGGFTRVATIATGLAGVMDLQFDRELNDLWAICDNTCQGQSVVLRIGVGTGVFGVTQKFNRPGGMPNLNNEGFAFTPLTECVADRRPAFWADDSETGGHSIRLGTLTCTAL